MNPHQFDSRMPKPERMPSGTTVRCLACQRNIKANEMTKKSCPK